MLEINILILCQYNILCRRPQQGPFSIINAYDFFIDFFANFMMGAIFTNKKYAFPVSCTHLLDMHQSCVEPSYPILTSTPVKFSV